ncbi:hypothetical protein MP638_001643 [Amoeboaphelidium occidentale]|nr:hypothetical protein MP638_001643 [Amoeboaphelidium occidentale]
MKSFLLTALTFMLLVSLVFAVPTGDQSSDATQESQETSQKESKLDQLFQKFLQKMKITKEPVTSTSKIETEPSPHLDIPDDLWKSSILPKLSGSDHENLRLANKQSKSIVDLLYKDFSPVFTACDEETAKTFFRQQYSANYLSYVHVPIYRGDGAKKAHRCIWATKKWVETLDKPQTIRFNILVLDVDATADFLTDEDLFEVTKKLRFSISITVSQTLGKSERLIQAVSTNKSITRLDIHELEEDVDQMKMLTKALNNNTSITELKLWKSRIGFDGAVALANELESNTALLELDLWGSSIGQEGLMKLAEALKNNTKLQKLSLRDSEVDAGSAEAFAGALNVNTALETLDLSGNQIGDAGVRALAQALEANVPLKRLKLNSISINPEGFMALAGALKTNQKLLYLGLKNTGLALSDLQQLVSALQENTCLQELVLSATDLPNAFLYLSPLARKKTKNGKPFFVRVAG